MAKIISFSCLTLINLLHLLFNIEEVSICFAVYHEQNKEIPSSKWNLLKFETNFCRLFRIINCSIWGLKYYPLKSFSDVQGGELAEKFAFSSIHFHRTNETSVVQDSVEFKSMNYFRTLTVLAHHSIQSSFWYRVSCFSQVRLNHSLRYLNEGLINNDFVCFTFGLALPVIPQYTFCMDFWRRFFIYLCYQLIIV